MKLLPRLLVSILLIRTLAASEDALAMIPLPLDTRQAEILVVEVPFVIGMAMPESAFQAIGIPYIPPAVSFHKQEDINMASVAGIKVLSDLKEDDSYRIALDYGAVDEKHQTEELLRAVVDCVYRVAERGEGYQLEVVLKNLKEDSPLHAVLKQAVAERKPAPKPAAGGDSTGE
ncbi:hypothetical protein [Haloferula rosea]|uniref:Uncharacterized protein n=1 Tax=Haloferula rosea TaxID=490093 RepID=A0A934RCQ9_9BACT|nr:hypothetical protein [Haloferula rosea]MBK1828293.1 hypothetical protein [Haloferula rosea]